MSTDTYNITGSEVPSEGVVSAHKRASDQDASDGGAPHPEDTLPSIDRGLVPPSLAETVRLPKESLKITSNFSLFDPTEDRNIRPQQTPRVDLPTPRCDFDTYTLTELSAEGGTARIYRAFESHSKDPVAIKLLRRRFQNDPFISGLFKRHGEAMKKLDVSHFAKVLDTGTSPWGPWWSLEWIEGYTLRAAIDRGTRWSSGRLFKLMLQLCEALEGLHAIGITHGDLSADNVMYTPPTRPEGQEKFTLIDLALPIKLHLADDVQKLDDLEEDDDYERHSTEQRMSDELRVFGQPIYLAPECLKGQRPSHRTDLYSLGMLFFELTTGTLPFQTKLPGVIHDVLNKNAPAASMIQNPWPYPPALDALIGNLLSKVPSERCNSAQEVKEQLLQMMTYMQGRHELTATDDLLVHNLDQSALPHDDIEETLSGVMAQEFRDELINLRAQHTQAATAPATVDSPLPKEIRSKPPSTEPPQMEYSEAGSGLIDPYDPQESHPPETSPPRARAAYSSVKPTPQYTPPRASLSSARRVQLDEDHEKSSPSWQINLLWMLIGMGVTLIIRYLL